MIIGICGIMGSGKTMLAEALRDHFASQGHPAEIRPFAGTLKRIARSMGWDGEKDPRGRRLLQGLGSILRQYDTDAWISLWRRSLPDRGIVIVDDVRYQNEMDAIRKDGGIIVHRIRPGHDTAWKKICRLLHLGRHGHASERWYPRDPDYVIDCDIEALNANEIWRGR